MRLRLPDPPLIYAAMANYLYYLLLETMFSIAIIGVIMVVAMIIRCKSISNFKIHQTARAIIPLLKAGEGDTRDKPVTMFHGHPVSDHRVKKLLHYSLSIIGICIIMFVFHYILEKVYGCTLDNGFDCFGDIWQQLDCENSTELKDVTPIVCYRFSYDITHALSEVISVLSISVGFINFITWILRKAVNLKCMAHKRKAIRYLVVTLLHSGIMLVVYTMILLKMCLMLITRDLYKISAHVSDMAEVLIYSFVLYIGLEVPWQQFDTVSYNRCSPINGPETRLIDGARVIRYS